MVDQLVQEPWLWIMNIVFSMLTFSMRKYSWSNFWPSLSTIDKDDHHPIIHGLISLLLLFMMSRFDWWCLLRSAPPVGWFITGVSFFRKPRGFKGGFNPGLTLAGVSVVWTYQFEWFERWIAPTWTLARWRRQLVDVFFSRHCNSCRGPDCGETHVGLYLS